MLRKTLVARAGKLGGLTAAQVEEAADLAPPARVSSVYPRGQRQLYPPPHR